MEQSAPKGQQWNNVAKVIILRRLIPPYYPAPLTFVNNDKPLLPILIYRDWLHQSSAIRRPIPRSFAVNMFGPQTHRAVIAVRSMPERLYLRVAVLTDERFLAGEKNHSFIFSTFHFPLSTLNSLTSIFVFSFFSFPGFRSSRCRQRCRTIAPTCTRCSG